MSDPRQHTWNCPSCGRRVPINFDKCRCGLTRDQAETLRRDGGQASTASAPELSSPTRSFGHALTAFLVVALIAVVCTVGILMLGRKEPPKTGQNIRVLLRLDDYTRVAGRNVPNVIPTFLATPGHLGVVEGGSEADAGKATSDSTTTLTVKDISPSDLLKGVCSPNVPRLVRQQYPGSYDDWPDDKLERTVLSKHPEYRYRLCILPPWIEAAPHDIVKYEFTAGPGFVAEPRVLLLTTLLTAGIAVVVLTVYSKLR